MTRDQEFWGIALWLEKTKGSEAPDHIARDVARLAAQDDQAGIAMWRAVSERYDQLRKPTTLN